jgi:hypothetical protein
MRALRPAKVKMTLVLSRIFRTITIAAVRIRGSSLAEFLALRFVSGVCVGTHEKERRFTCWRP